MLSTPRGSSNSKASLSREQREILHGQDDRLLVAVVDVLVINPRRAQERIALLPFDLRRFRVVFVLHDVEAAPL
jgi:hypothetical protein